MRRWSDLTEREKNRRKRALKRQGLLAFGALALVAVILLAGTGVARLFRGKAEGTLPVMEQVMPAPSALAPEEPPPPPEIILPSGPAKDGDPVMLIGDEIYSETAILIDADENIVLAAKDPDKAVSPASMTKVMTVLAAVEAIEDLDQECFIPAQVIDYFYRQGATTTGLRRDEATTPRELLHGAALRSAGDAGEALARIADGDTDAFLARMNRKAKALGLSEETHFANTSGLYSEGHTVTARDMAAIMLAAMQNETCAQLFSTVRYTVREPSEGDDGIVFYNKYLQWFHEKQPQHNAVTACKSGYVWQAKNCIVTYAVGESGKHYICVTTGAPNASNMMNDQRLILGTYGG